MSPTRSRTGMATYELIAALGGLALLGTLVVGASAAMRQLQRVESASARLEEAQNLLAAWRAGGTASAPGWTAEVRPAADGGEVLVLRGHDLRLATVRRREARP